VKILHVIPGISPTYGGPSRAIRIMAHDLVQAGHDVTIVTTTADGDRELDKPLGVAQLEDGANVLYFPRQSHTWTFSWPLWRWLQANTKRFDVAHVHALFSFPTLPACLAARRAGVPYIVRPLGLLDAWSLGRKRWKKAPYFRLVERKNLRAAAALHATSRAEARHLEQLGLADKTHVLPLGIPLPEPLEARTEHDPVRLVFYGRLHSKKALPAVLAALRLLRDRGRDVELLVAGSGEPDYVGELERQTRELELTDAVDFLGFVEPAAQRAVFARADIFVLPSWQENFGIAVAEALALGRPVIVSDQVALAAEVARANVGKVIPPGDATALAAAVDELVEEGDWQALAQRARELVENEFSRERQLEALEQLYARLTTDVPAELAA